MTDQPAAPALAAQRGEAAAAGVLAMGAGLGAGHLAASLTAPASSPVVAVANRVVDLSPAPLREWAIATLGTADKAVLVAGVVVVTLGLGAGLGLATRRARPLGWALAALLVAVALAAAFEEPGRPAAWPVPGLVALATGLAALALLVRPRPAAPGPPRPGAGRADRRRFLALGASVGGAGLVSWLIGDRLAGGVPAQRRADVTLPPRSATPLPAGLEGDLPGLSPFETPASAFYRIDTALLVPGPDTASWRLTIDGMVDRPLTIGWDELLAMDAVERPVTLACVSNEVGGDLIGSARWLGVRTSELLRRAGVQAGADQVLSTSVDGFTVSTPLQALTDGRDALVAYGMNGAPLPPEHGFPVRLLTPGLYGFVGATKWLVRMTVTTYAARSAYWTVRGWSTTGVIKPGSRIEVPAADSKVARGGVRVGGTAWAHGVGVGRVQVRVNGGPWQDAALGPEAGVDYWRQWLWQWDAPAGVHELQCRVVDAAGAAQSEQDVEPFPDGATGLHTVRVTVA